MEISSSSSQTETVTTRSHAGTQTEPSATSLQIRESMPYSYLHLLSRISTRATSSSVPQTEMEGYRYDGVLDLLLQQPLEIRQLILNWLEPNDLLSLRMTSHTLHTAVHDSERAICVGLAEHISKYHDLFNLAMVVPNLSAFFRVSRQYHSICRLGRVIADRICSYTKLDTISTDDKEILEKWRQRKSTRLEKRLARALLILQHYLNFLLETLIINEMHLESLDDEDYTGLHNIFDLDQQDFLAKHMSGLEEHDFIDVTASLAILKTVCKARYIPFNLKTHAHPFASVRQILIYKGLAPFAELLDKDTTHSQQDILLRRLSREIGEMRRSSEASANSPSLGTIQHLDGYSQSLHVLHDQRRSSKARDVFISHQDIWDRAARALMMPKLGRFPTVQTPTAWIQQVVIEDEREQDVTLGTWDKAERA